MAILQDLLIGIIGGRAKTRVFGRSTCFYLWAIIYARFHGSGYLLGYFGIFWPIFGVKPGFLMKFRGRFIGRFLDFGNYLWDYRWVLRVIYEELDIMGGFM